MLSQSQQGSTLLSVTSFTNTSDILPIWAHLNGLVTLLNAWDQWSCLSWQDLYPSFWVMKTRIRDSSHFCTWKFSCLWLPLEKQFISSFTWWLDITSCSIRVSQILKANSSFEANKDTFFQRGEQWALALQIQCTGLSLLAWSRHSVLHWYREQVLLSAPRSSKQFSLDTMRCPNIPVSVMWKWDL